MLSQQELRQDYVECLFQKYAANSSIYIQKNKKIEQNIKPLISTYKIKKFEYLTRRNQKHAVGYSFQTRISSAFNQHAQIFYANSSSTKVLCDDLTCFENLLTPTVLAYWFMDDGSWPNKKSKSFVLYTNAYKSNEILYLSNLLNKKFDLITKIGVNKNQSIIRISAKSYGIFFILINPILKNIPSAKWKFPIRLNE